MEGLKVSKNDDIWVKKCLVTGVTSFQTKKGDTMYRLLYLDSNGETQRLFLSKDFDMTKISKLKQFVSYVVKIVINGTFVCVVDIEV